MCLHHHVTSCNVFAQVTVSDVTSNNLVSASNFKIIIMDCETLDTPAFIDMTQEVIRARGEDEKYNGRESDYDHIRLNQATYNTSYLTQYSCNTNVVSTSVSLHIPHFSHYSFSTIGWGSL